MAESRHRKKRPFGVSFCGANGNRTSDTRIFSPLLYQLSYGTSRSANRTIGCRVATLSARLPPLSPLHVFCGNPIESPHSRQALWGPHRHPTRAKLFGDPVDTPLEQALWGPRGWGLSSESGCKGTTIFRILQILVPQQSGLLRENRHFDTSSIQIDRDAPMIGA